jgi:hypothetical protein
MFIDNTLQDFSGFTYNGTLKFTLDGATDVTYCFVDYLNGGSGNVYDIVTYTSGC